MSVGLLHALMEAWRLVIEQTNNSRTHKIEPPDLTNGTSNIFFSGFTHGTSTMLLNRVVKVTLYFHNVTGESQ